MLEYNRTWLEPKKNRKRGERAVPLPQEDTARRLSVVSQEVILFSICTVKGLERMGYLS